MGGDEYSIADIASWPWYGNLVLGNTYDAADFLQVKDYKHVRRWTEKTLVRPAMQRGHMVNRADPSKQLHERHDASDFELRTQDKLST